MNIESRPITAAGWAMLHRIATGDTDTLARLLGYFRDPGELASESWQFLRLAETNAWKAVELLLLRRMIERRANEGKLDAWVQATPLGEEIRDGRLQLLRLAPLGRVSRGATQFRSIGVSGASCRSPCWQRPAAPEQRNPTAANAEDIMEQMAARLADRFPLLAQAVRNPKLDLPAMTWFILDCRIRYNFETLVALPCRTPPPNPGLEDLVVLFINCPSRVEELIGDVYADVGNSSAESRWPRCGRRFATRTTTRTSSKTQKAEVEAMLGSRHPDPRHIAGRGRRGSRTDQAD